jgi:DNA-binding beta-propeller fold protein YncE
MTPRLWTPTRPAAPRFRPALLALEDRTVPTAFEVWSIDQSSTRDENGNGSVTDTVDSGGTLYIYRGSDLSGHNAAGAVPEVIDLGGAARNFAVAQTGTAPIRPHMMLFNATHSHAIIANVASGHVVFLDAASRAPVGVIDVGVQAHAAFPAPDDSYLVVANQNGKMLHRIFTDYGTNTFTLDPVALNLAVGTTPSGALRQDPVLRPDTAPICPVIESSGQFTFVTLRGGGMFVVDTRAPAMQIVAEYDRATVHPDGCGGVEVGGKMYINSGGPGEADLYAFPVAGFDAVPNPPNSPAPTLVFRQGGDPNQFQVDSHGATLTKHGRYIWVADRWANKVVVVDPRTDTVVNEINLVGAVSGDPTPDLIDISPSGNRVFAALRGPRPLSGNNMTFNNAVGSTPGVGVIQVTQGGRDGELIAVAPVSHVVGGLERADMHALRVRVIRERPVHGAAAGAGGQAAWPGLLRQAAVAAGPGGWTVDWTDLVTHGGRVEGGSGGEAAVRTGRDRAARRHTDLNPVLAYDLGRPAVIEDADTGHAAATRDSQSADSHTERMDADVEAPPAADTDWA